MELKNLKKLNELVEVKNQLEGINSYLKGSFSITIELNADYAPSKKVEKGFIDSGVYTAFRKCIEEKLNSINNQIEDLL